jgi:hypothetical protein
MVTAEAAIVIPVIVLVAAALTWLVVLVIAQIQVVDAARDAARAMARGDDADAAIGHAVRVAPEGADVSVSESADQTVTVTVEVEARAPGWMLVPLPAVHLESRATTVREEDVAR